MTFTKEVQELAHVATHVYHATPHSRRRIRKFPLPAPRSPPTTPTKKKRSRRGRRMLLRTRTMVAVIQEAARIVGPGGVVGKTRSAASAQASPTLATTAPAQAPATPHQSSPPVPLAGEPQTPPVRTQIFEVRPRCGETTITFEARKRHTSSVAFCIDRSGSMGRWVPGCGTASHPITRFDVIVDHLMELLEMSDPGLMYTVMLFDWNVHKWRYGRLVPNSPQNRQSLQAFLRSMGPSGGTNLLAGVSELVRTEADERFLLADGEGGGRPVVDKAQQTPINCVGVGMSTGSVGYKMLIEVATASGGSTTFLMDKDLHHRDMSTKALLPTAA